MATKIDQLPKGKRDAAVRDIVLGRRSMFQVAKDLKITDTTVNRYMREKVTDGERNDIIVNNIAASKLKDAHNKAAIIDTLGEDTDKDLKWVLRELKSLLEGAKDDEDRTMQLGTLKEVRQSLMSLADLHGKLNKKMDIHLNLNESPQFIQLRKIILTVLDRHPEAKTDFLDEMKALQVIEAKPPS